MVFKGCSFEGCRKFDFECGLCSSFCKDDVLESFEPIHPVLNVLMSKVPIE